MEASVETIEKNNKKSALKIERKNNERLQEEIERLHDTIDILIEKLANEEKAITHAVLLLNVIIDKKFVKKHFSNGWINELTVLLDKWESPVSLLAKTTKKELQKRLELFNG